MPESYGTYAQIKERLDQIVEAAGDDAMPIDDALALYEEAVKLGLAASNLIEQDIAARDADELSDDEEGAASGEGKMAPAASRETDAAAGDVDAAADESAASCASADDGERADAAAPSDRIPQDR